jgi:hypothetical protein
MNPYPVQVRARRDEPLSRWLWLVKWLLLIPHFVVLAVLWVAFVALTLIAYVAVFFTGRYPRAIFEFNVGVLRWTWRVGFYGYQVLGTDRYPPFTLAEVPDYPAGLLLEGPPRLPRWLPLVAWLLAIPHLLLLGALTGAIIWPLDGNDTTLGSLDVVAISVLIVAISLTVRGRIPQGLHDLLVGVARWSLRVGAYVALLTGTYPPFRLDQGDAEPDTDRVDPMNSSPITEAAAPPAPVASSAAGGVGRVLALVIGVFLLVTSIGVGIAGGGLLVLGANRDAQGFVTSPALDLATPTAAVTAEGIEILTGDALPEVLVDYGQVRINVSSPSTAPVFVGIARQSDVDQWLADAAHDRLTSYGVGGAHSERAAGLIGDATAPTEQSFWIASASGTSDVVLNWQATDGRFAIVVANANGAHGVAATATIATRIPEPTPLGAGLLGGALLLAILAFALIYLGAAGVAPRRAGSVDPESPSGGIG